MKIIYNEHYCAPDSEILDLYKFVCIQTSTEIIIKIGIGIHSEMASALLEEYNGQFLGAGCIEPFKNEKNVYYDSDTCREEFGTDMPEDTDLAIQLIDHIRSSLMERGILKKPDR